MAAVLARLRFLAAARPRAARGPTRTLAAARAVSTSWWRNAGSGGYGHGDDSRGVLPWLAAVSAAGALLMLGRDKSKALADQERSARRPYSDDRKTLSFSEAKDMMMQAIGEFRSAHPNAKLPRIVLFKDDRAGEGMYDVRVEMAVSGTSMESLLAAIHRGMARLGKGQLVIFGWNSPSGRSDRLTPSSSPTESAPIDDTFSGSPMMGLPERDLPYYHFSIGNTQYGFTYNCHGPSGSLVITKRHGLHAADVQALVDLYMFISQHLVRPLSAALEEMGLRVYVPEKSTDWNMLAGYERAKNLIRDNVVLAMRHPEVYKRIVEGTRVHPEINRPKAMLFEGPAGTGKTTMARLIATEVDVPLVYLPLEKVVSMFYGEAERNLDKVFTELEKMGPAIVFIDEIDSLSIRRDHLPHEASRRMLSVLLRRIDGFEKNPNVLVIGATNRKSDLDEALLSRFDTSITFALPTEAERVGIFRIYAKHLPEKAAKELALLSDGLSGRDIKQICSGAERQWASKIISKKQKENTLPAASDYKDALNNYIRKYDS